MGWLVNQASRWEGTDRSQQQRQGRGQSEPATLKRNEVQNTMMKRCIGSRQRILMARVTQTSPPVSYVKCEPNAAGSKRTRLEPAMVCQRMGDPAILTLFSMHRTTYQVQTSSRRRLPTRTLPDLIMLKSDATKSIFVNSDDY
jgi:hypothetical protein